MDRDRSTATHSGRRRATRGTGRRGPRQQVRRGAIPAGRRRRSSALVRDARATRRGHRGTTTRKRSDGASGQSLPSLAGVGVVDPPRGLAWLLALARSGEPSRALTASGLLWLFVYAGWRAGVLDAAATLWLSASVVAVNHVLRAAERPRGRQTAREPGGDRLPVESRVGR